MNLETPRPTHIALPQDEEELACPTAPYLPSCFNFYSPSPVSLSQHRFCFAQLEKDLEHESPVLQRRYDPTFPIGGNLLGLFIEEKGVLEEAIERIEYDPRYSSVFAEEEDENDMPYDIPCHLGSPYSSPPALVRSGSGCTASSVSSSDSDLSSPPPTGIWYGQAHKALHDDNDEDEHDRDDVEIVQDGAERDAREDEDDPSFESSWMPWRIPAYLREPPSACTSSASTPSFSSLTPIPYDLAHMASTSTSMDMYSEPQRDLSLSHPLEDLFHLSAPSSWTRRSSGEAPEKRRKLAHRSARVINGALFCS